METEYSFIKFLHKNQLFFQPLTRNRDNLGLVLNPRDGLEERDDIFSFFSFSNNVILLDITNTSYNYIKLIITTLSLMIPNKGGVKFSWPVARENLTEGSLSHGSQFTEYRNLTA